MRFKEKPPYPSVLAIYLCFSSCLFERSHAQATTDPSEVRALNSIFQQWDISANPNLWNISGEPCTGAATNAREFDDTYFNPAIKCDCSFDNGSTCHITQLRVYDLGKEGAIPEELASLTHLTNLRLDKNHFTGTLPGFLGNLSKMQDLSVGHNLFSGTIPKEIGSLLDLRFLN